jgi:anti-sigma regulatory factor (Ser/Thr protein kinase)
MQTKWSRNIERPEEVRPARDDFRAFLAREGYREGAAADLLIIFGELLANACEHGRLPVTIALAANGKLKLRVKDSGHGIVRPTGARPIDSIRGRGLEIIEKLGGLITIDPPPSSAIVVTMPN